MKRPYDTGFRDRLVSRRVSKNNRRLFINFERHGREKKNIRSVVEESRGGGGGDVTLVFCGPDNQNTINHRDDSPAVSYFIEINAVTREKTCVYNGRFSRGVRFPSSRVII